MNTDKSIVTITPDTEMSDKQKAFVATCVANRRGKEISQLKYIIRAAQQHLKRGNAHAARAMLRGVK